MASIETTRVWKGITVKESTDTSTGKITLKNTSGVELASSSSAEWTMENRAAFTRLYNNSNDDISRGEFDQLFFNKGVKKFDKDRANILNDESNYNGPKQAKNRKTSFFEAGIPGIDDPRTGRSVNSDGIITSERSDGNDPGESGNIGSFSVRSNGPSSGSVSKSSGGSLRYPVAQLPDLDYDFVQFEIYDYVNKGNLVANEASDRLGSKLGTITLPMVGNLGEQSSVDWGEDRLNAMQAAVGQAAMKTMENVGDFGAAVGDLTQAAQGMSKQAGVQRQLAAYFAGQALGVNLQARSTGNVLNPNLELLFKGPKLRAFNFNFKFRPRFEAENIMVRQIIKAFKRSMAPNRTGGYLFLQTPNVFKVKYLHKGDDHPFMNHIKPCALTDFTVSYTPDNAYMTYPDGGLTGYDVQFTMGEILPIFQDDHDKVGGTGY